MSKPKLKIIDNKNNQLIPTLPNYEPTLDKSGTKLIDRDIRDLQSEYPNGFICCGCKREYKKYSSVISAHFNTQKHMTRCLIPANKEFNENCGNTNNKNELVNNLNNTKRENREYKKIISEYRQEIDNLNIENKELHIENKQLHIKNNQLQEKIEEMNKYKTDNISMF